MDDMRMMAAAEVNTAEYVYDSTGSCRGRCWACLGRPDEYGERHTEHHALCPQRPDAPWRRNTIAE